MCGYKSIKVFFSCFSMIDFLPFENLLLFIFFFHFEIGTLTGLESAFNQIFIAPFSNFIKTDVNFFITFDLLLISEKVIYHSFIYIYILYEL